MYEDELFFLSTLFTSSISACKCEDYWKIKLKLRKTSSLLWVLITKFPVCFGNTCSVTYLQNSNSYEKLLLTFCHVVINVTGCNNKSIMYPCVVPSVTCYNVVRGGGGYNKRSTQYPNSIRYWHKQCFSIHQL